MNITNTRNITEKIKSRVLQRKTRALKPKQRHTAQPNKIRDIISIRRNINRLPRTPRRELRLNLEREFNLHLGLKHLNDKYGPERIMKWYWTPNFIKNGLPLTTDIHDDEFEHDLRVIHQSLESHHLKPDKHLLNWFVEQVQTETDRIIKKYPALKDITELERYALFRYWVVGALNSISLSVSPETKYEWGINFELFGAFYNTDYPYCGLYPELERRCVSDVFHFELKPNMTILVNPPYTEEWIEKACELVSEYLEQDMNTTIWLVVPVWNIKDRKKLGLKLSKNMPILEAMKSSPYLKSREITNLEFYNGLEKKHVHLKDKVHVFHLSNSS
jgi:hypothetical protein